MATKAQVKKCIETIAPLAMAEYKKGKKILPSVCIAQACCESGYFTSQKMINANAVFGIKVGKSKYHFGKAWKDKAYSTKTKECYDGKTYTEITDMFRAYDTIQESVEDYYDLLCNASRYKKAVGETNPKKAITSIKDGGYATDPKYVSTIMSIINSNNLTQYDMVGNTEKGRRSTVKYGSRGEDVVYLQQRLTTNGYGVGAIDGIFGVKTLEAVKAFQEKSKLSIDGIVGVKTWVALG